MLAIPNHLKRKVEQTFRRQQLLWPTTLSWRPTWRRLLLDSTQSWDRPKEMTRSSKTFPISILSLSACPLWSPTTAGRQSVEKMEDLICWLQVGEASEAAAPTGRRLAGPVERTHVDYQVRQVLRQQVDKLASRQVLGQDVDNFSSHFFTSSPDPFSNVVSPAEAQNLFNNDDAFAAFNKDVSG